MSRTRRNYHHERKVNVLNPIWERKWISLGENYYSFHKDPRHAYTHGYDGASPQYYYECTSYPPCGWKENNRGCSRKHVKKALKRSRRRYHKMIDNKELQEFLLE